MGTRIRINSGNSPSPGAYHGKGTRIQAGAPARLFGSISAAVRLRLRVRVARDPIVPFIAGQARAGLEMRNRRSILWTIGSIAAAIAIAPSYLRTYRVQGSSAAPSYLRGDLILVNKAAFDLRVPYADTVIAFLSQPQRGDVVMFQPAGRDYYVFKRVVGCPGDTLTMQEDRLTLDGAPLHYENAAGYEIRSFAQENRLGSVIAWEIGNGPRHMITFTPGASELGTFGPVTVPAEHYYLLGDNRDNSEDSRMYGPVPRQAIVGKISGSFGRRSRE